MIRLLEMATYICMQVECSLIAGRIFDFIIEYVTKCLEYPAEYLFRAFKSIYLYVCADFDDFFFEHLVFGLEPGQTLTNFKIVLIIT